MRKIFSLIAIVMCFVLVFAACGETAGTSSETASTDVVSEAVSSEDVASEEASSEEASSEEETSSEEPVSSEDPVVEEINIEDHPNYTKEYTVVQKPLSERNNSRRAKILIMGDSYTSGDGTASAYRHALFTTLYEEGCFFEFVGDRSSSDVRLTKLYQAHLAAGGRTTPQLEDTYKSAVSGGKKNYDIALILIGGNDLYGSATSKELADRFESLIKAMYEDRPDATVFFSEMCYYGGIATSKIDEANRALKIIIEDYQAKGYDVRYVDLDEYVTFTSADDLMNAPPSGSHPNQQGNWKLGYAYGMAMKEAVLEVNTKKPHDDQRDAIDPKSITLSKTEMTLKIDEQGSVYYTIAPEDSEVVSAIWSSSDPSVATVDEYGVVTAHKAGKAVLSARVTGTNIIGTVDVTVTNETFKLEYAGAVEILYEPFNNGTNWEGDTNRITNGVKKYYVDSVSVTSIEKLKCDNQNTSITFMMLCSGQVGKTSGYSKISFGDYTLVSYNNMEKIELIHGERVLGTFVGEPYTFPADRFTLNFIDGNVTVYRNNETIITAKAPTNIDGVIKIDNNGGGTFFLSALAARTGK